jgi:cleavage and polyadenylation specificity factor subunit 1
MYALHSTLLPPSAIHHSLFLPHFTPSTIYPLPKAHAVGDSAEVKVVGNLVVAGGQDLRVFEIREELRPVQEAELPADGTDLPDDLGDSFFDAPTQVRYNRMQLVDVF